MNAVRTLDAIHADIHERVGDDYEVLDLAVELEAAAGLAGRAAVIDAVDEAIGSLHPGGNDTANSPCAIEYYDGFEEAVDRVLAILDTLREEPS